MENGEIQAVTWEAPEFQYREKGRDWYISVTIIFVCLIIAASMFDYFNFLFLTLLFVGGFSMVVMAAKKPAIIPFEVNSKGVRVGDERIYFRNIDSYFIDREDPLGVRMLVLKKEHFAPLLVMPLPAEYIDEVEFLMEQELEEKELREPLLMKLLEIFGF